MSPHGDPGIAHPDVYSREMITQAHAETRKSGGFASGRQTQPVHTPQRRSAARRGPRAAGPGLRRISVEFWPRALENQSVVARGRGGGRNDWQGQQRGFGGVCQNR